MHRPIKPARREGKGKVMRKMRDLLTCCYFVLGVVLPSWAQGVLENPSAHSFQSGIGLVSGWKCTPGIITIGFDGAAAQIQAAAGTTRADTAGACGGSANNGFGLLWNFNLLGAGAKRVGPYKKPYRHAASPWETIPPCPGAHVPRKHQSIGHASAEGRSTPVTGGAALGFSKECPAVSYSPAGPPLQYHRR